MCDPESKKIVNIKYTPGHTITPQVEAQVSTSTESVESSLNRGPREVSFTLNFGIVCTGCYISSEGIIKLKEMSLSVNMAAVAAKMASADTDDREGLVYDAGEIRSYDLAVGAQNISPSKAQQRIWNAQVLDASTGLNNSEKQSTGVETAHLRMAEAKRRMLSLRTEVIDSLDIQSALREDTRQRLHTISDRAAISGLEALDTLRAFDSGYVHLDPTGHDVRKVMGVSQVALQMPFFDSFGLPVRIPTEEAIHSYLMLASSRLLSDEESAQLCYSIRKDVTSALFPVDDKKIPEMLCSVNRFTKMDVVRSVTDALAKHDGSLASLDAEISRVEAEITQSMSKEKFDDAERLTATLLTLSGRRTDIKALQLAILAGDGGDATPDGKPTSKPAAAGFLKALDRLLYDPAIPTLRGEKVSLISTANGDLGKLAAHHAIQLKDNEVATARYNLWVGDSIDRLKSNQATQQSLWRNIFAILDELEVAGQEHELLATEHVKATEAEQRRRQDHREYLDSHRKHTVCLEDLVRNSEVALSFLESLNAKFQQARQELERSGVEARLQELLEMCRKGYLSAFGHYGMNSNQHTARFDQRAANHEHLIQELAFAQQQAALLGDTDKGMYARRYNELDRQRRSALDKVTDFGNDYQVRENNFIEIAANVQVVQRARAESMRAQTGLPPTTFDGNSDEGELLASLRGSRAASIEGHLARLTTVAKKNQASLEAIRQQLL